MKPCSKVCNAIYCIWSCDNVYTEENGRPLGTRVKEHRKELENITGSFIKAEKNKGGKHLQQMCNHRYMRSKNHVTDSTMSRWFIQNQTHWQWQTHNRGNIIITSGQSNLTTGRITIKHGQFNGIRQVAPVYTHLNTCFHGPTQVQSRTASRLVQPFLHRSRQGVAILYNRPQGRF